MADIALKPAQKAVSFITASLRRDVEDIEQLRELLSGLYLDERAAEGKSSWQEIFFPWWGEGQQELLENEMFEEVEILSRYLSGAVDAANSLYNEMWDSGEE